VPLLEKDEAPEETETASAAVDNAVTLAAIKAALGDDVSEVRASQRLTDSAACLVASGAGPDRQLERLLARQGAAKTSKPVLEVNMRHPLVKALAEAKAAAVEADVTDLSTLLFEQAQILDGELPADPAAFALRLNRLIVRGFTVRPA
jgi:molecular chaperone HtpG